MIADAGVGGQELLGMARRLEPLPLDRKGELVQAHPEFQIVISYNPGYQSAIKDLKPRFEGLAWLK